MTVFRVDADPISQDGQSACCFICHNIRFASRLPGRGYRVASEACHRSVNVLWSAETSM